MRAKLKLLRGSNKGKVLEIRHRKYIIGRAEGCQLRPNHEAISRQHCAVRLYPDKVTIQDLKSRNGTYLNGEALTEETPLATGDEVRLGPLKFEVLLTDDAGKLLTPPGPDPEEHMVAGNPGDSGLISQWLEEADAQANSSHGKSETRKFKLDDADIETLNDTTRASANDETQSLSKKDKKKKPGKLPTRQTQIDAANSQEAAAETLKKLFNRGG